MIEVLVVPEHSCSVSVPKRQTNYLKRTKNYNAHLWL